MRAIFILFVYLFACQLVTCSDSSASSFSSSSSKGTVLNKLKGKFMKLAGLAGKGASGSNLKQDSTDSELNYPFTTTVRYDYTQAFLLGLDLDSYFEYASDCTDSTILFIDDTAYLGNNVSLRLVNWDPVLNFTHMIEGNFSDSIVYCYQFSFSVYGNTWEKFQEFGNFSQYIIGFVFNQMGNALAFKSIFDDITEDRAAGYTTDIAYQYGRLLRKMFDFQPLAQLESYETQNKLAEQFLKMLERLQKEGSSSIEEEEEERLALFGVDHSQRKRDFKTLAEAKSVRSAGEQERKQRRAEDRRERNQRNKDRIREKRERQEAEEEMRQAMLRNSPKVEALATDLQFSTRPFWYTFYSVNGLLQGSIDVFPDDSFIYLCKENTTETVDNGDIIKEYWTYAFDNRTEQRTADEAEAAANGDDSVTYTKGIDEFEESMVIALEGLTGIFGNSYGISFNCYFSYDEVTSPETYQEVFAILNILSNVLYGLGYIISNVQEMLGYADSETEGYLYYYKMGYQSGNSAIRVFYTPEAALNS